MRARRARCGGRKCPVEHRHADRREHAATRPLEHAKEHQLEHRLRQAAERRREGEQRDREHERSLGAEAIADPARRRDPHRQAHQVADDDPVGCGCADGEAARDRGQRDVDDGHVHDRHEHRDDVDRPDDLLGAQPRRAHPAIVAQRRRAVSCATRTGHGDRLASAAPGKLGAWRSRSSGTSSCTSTTSSGRQRSTATCSAGSSSSRPRQRRLWDGSRSRSSAAAGRITSCCSSRSARTRRTLPSGRHVGLYHFGLKVGDTDDELRAAIQRCQEAGVHSRRDERSHRDPQPLHHGSRRQRDRAVHRRSRRELGSRTT